MPELQYLQLQPVEPTDDGTTSPLDDFQHDDPIDLSQEVDGDDLQSSWEHILTELDKEPDTVASR
jgi:hypothetical protein